MSSSIPETMRAIVVEKEGGPEVLESKPSYKLNPPKPDQVLVRNRIAGINFIDCYFRQGTYPAQKPIILGREAAGTIAAIGSSVNSSLGFKEGDRVVWCNWTGSYAEYVAIPAEKVVKIPDGVSDEEAAGGILMGLTALSILQESYRVKQGDHILIHAAAGATGLLMTQYAKSVGATVIGTAGGPEKCQIAKDNGADHVIDYKQYPKKEDWLPKVKELTPNNEGVDAVFDGVGKDTADGTIDVVKRKGTIVFFGAASGPVPDIPVARLRPKNSMLCRPTMENYAFTRAELERYTDQFFECLLQKIFKIKIYKEYPLEEVQQAHKDLQARITSGKLLLRI